MATIVCQYSLHMSVFSMSQNQKEISSHFQPKTQAKIVLSNCLPEVVSPLRHAVRLVDDDPAEQVAVVQALQHPIQPAARHQLLRRDVQQGGTAGLAGGREGVEAGVDLPVSSSVLARQVIGGYPESLQLGHLGANSIGS